MCLWTGINMPDLFVYTNPIIYHIQKEQLPQLLFCFVNFIRLFRGENVNKNITLA